MGCVAVQVVQFIVLAAAVVAVVGLLLKDLGAHTLLNLGQADV
jgi:hypothetical protein